MKRKLQVFMSSTYTDMLVERQAAVEAILRAGHIPAGMELFAAADVSQWETIKQWIEDSDVFMLILGGRYGSIEPSSGKSYIQLEYEYASSIKKPLFAAIISDSLIESKVRSQGTSAIEREHGALLTAFRETVKGKICRFFNDANELKLIVFESLGVFERNPTLSGWVRGTDVLDPKTTLDELSRLQSENVSLRAEIASLSAAIASLPSGDDDGIELSVDAKELLKTAAEFDGHILYIRYMGGAEIQTGNRGFISPSNSPREEARWKAAIDELMNHGCIESLGHKGESFRVTKLGYEVADRFKDEKS